MNKNGYFKCSICKSYQHTTTFGECSECGSEDLIKITKEEYDKRDELSENEIEKLAKEIRQFLLDNKLWIDVRIYFNGKAFDTSDGAHYYYNDPTHLVVLEDMDPGRYFKYVGNPHILSMSFEGDFCGCLNNYAEYGYEFDNKIQREFWQILSKYGVYYELGEHWNLTCYYV